MARIRSLHPGFWTDEAIVGLSFPARLLLQGLWTESDDQGVFEWKPVVLKMRLFPADDIDVGALLAELVQADCVKGYEVNGRRYGAVRNFTKYQRPKKPRAVHPLPDRLHAYVGLVGNQFPTSTEPVPHQGGKVSADGGDLGEKEEGKNLASEPIESLPSAVGAVDSVDKQASRARAKPENQGEVKPSTPFPTVWTIGEVEEAAAIAVGLFPSEVHGVFERFGDYHRDKGVLSNDWPARWRNWVRDEAKRLGREPRRDRVDLGGGRPPPPDPRVFLNPDMHPAQWAAWQAIRPTATNKQGGWYFPSEWPPGHEPKGQTDAAMDSEPVPQAAS